MEDMGLSLPALQEAIQALAANDTGDIPQRFERRDDDLEKMRQMAQSLQQMQQQTEKMGKDLAEQLQNGQPEAAHMTLKKMIQQLNTASLSPEQLQKLMRKSPKQSTQPAAYGNVAQHLRRRGPNARRQQTWGGTGLAQAAKELEKLMEQLGDAESLLAELKYLNQASMCVANGQCWGMGNRPGSKPGGRPGGGVGTWAEDENGAWNGQCTDRWDNSGIVRPDMELAAFPT